MSTHRHTGLSLIAHLICVPGLDWRLLTAETLRLMFKMVDFGVKEIESPSIPSPVPLCFHTLPNFEWVSVMKGDAHDVCFQMTSEGSDYRSENVKQCHTYGDLVEWSAHITIIFLKKENTGMIVSVITFRLHGDWKQCRLSRRHTFWNLLFPQVGKCVSVLSSTLGCGSEL